MNERLIPGIGERVGVTMKPRSKREKPYGVNGTVKRIVIDELGVYVTLHRLSGISRRSKASICIIEWPNGVQGWTRIRNDVRIVTHETEGEL